jgi:hypothetical protein
LVEKGKVPEKGIPKEGKGPKGKYPKKTVGV